MERILEYFKQFAPVSDEAWTYFKKHLALVKYHSGDIIHPLHKPYDTMGFILQGIARSYLHKSNGKDFTWFFHYDGDYCSAKQFTLIDYPSFNLKTPSIYGFQALSDCQVAVISFEDLCTIFKKYPELLLVEKKLVVDAYYDNNKRLESLLTKTAQELLEEFEQRQGSLFDRIPHYHIASFLGITPQRLCQLRKHSDHS